MRTATPTCCERAENYSGGGKKALQGLQTLNSVNIIRELMYTLYSFQNDKRFSLSQSDWSNGADLIFV